MNEGASEALAAEVSAQTNFAKLKSNKKCSGVTIPRLFEQSKVKHMRIYFGARAYC